MSDPLTVRISDGTTDRFVTKHVSNLRFTKVAPGGHQGLTFHLSLPRRVFEDLGPMDRCWVYDARNGDTVFGAAYLENPTPIDGPSGQSYEISAVGGMALANDESQALVYVDTNLSNFESEPTSAANASFNTGQDETYLDESRLRVLLSSGTPVSLGSVAAANNRLFERTGMNLGGIYVGAFYSGRPDPGWAEDLAEPNGIIYTRTMSDVGQTLELYVGSTIPAATRTFGFRLRRTAGATNVVDDTTWTNWVHYATVGQRMDRYGVLLTGLTGMQSANSVLASQVVEDVFGRLLRFCDPATTKIEATSFPISQLAWEDGVKAAGVLNELEQWEPDMVWEILESNAEGLHRFNYRAWPTDPRYVVSTADGYAQQGSDNDLCNRILVSWSDVNDKKQTISVTADDLGLVGKGLPVDALGARVKDADPISLPDGRGSLENAQRIGAAVLRDKISPPRAGGVTVRRPIVDRLTGKRVMPWEIDPGWLVLVRENGQLMRCTQVQYDHATRTAALTLGTPVLTVDQRVARLPAA